MFVSRTHRATRKNWSDLRSNEDGSEKNSKLDFTRNTDRKSFSFFAGQPCNQRAHPSRIDRPRER